MSPSCKSLKIDWMVDRGDGPVTRLCRQLLEMATAIPSCAFMLNPQLGPTCADLGYKYDSSQSERTGRIKFIEYLGTV